VEAEVNESDAANRLMLVDFFGSSRYANDANEEFDAGWTKSNLISGKSFISMPDGRDALNANFLSTISILLAFACLALLSGNKS
jgi:hypothetical protein